MGADCRLTVTVRPAGSPAELAAAMELRERVFCGEQGVAPELEFDGLDDACRQILALDEAGVVATCRLRETDQGPKLERMAVEPRLRGLGVGARLLDGAERIARDGGAQRLALHAQTRVSGFYRRAGYEAVGDPFLEVGIEHVRMSKALAGLP